MPHASILTRWTQMLIEGVPTNEPTLFADVSPGDRDGWTDLTGQLAANLPPRPNVLVVEINCSNVMLAAIKAHVQYGALAVLWEGDPMQSPVVTTAQYNSLVTFLANRFGATAIQVRNLLGATADGRTHVQIANEIIAYLRTRPKA